MDITSQNNKPQKDTRQLLEENQQLLRMILRNTEKTRKYVLFGRIMSALYLIMIVGSVILAAVALPPLINSVIGPYKELLGTPSTKGDINQGLFDKVQDFLKGHDQ